MADSSRSGTPHSDPAPSSAARSGALAVPSSAEVNRRRFLGLAGGVTTAALLAACGKDDPSAGSGPPAKSAPLTIWNGTFDAFGKGTNTTKKKDDYWLAQAITTYKAEHGTSITVESAPDGGPDLLTKIRTSGVARKGPDLATVWSGTYLLSVKDYLAPLSDQYPTDKRAGIVGWESVSEGLVDGGKLYGVPCGTDSLTCLYYNTKVLTKAGVSVDADKVQEWDEFIGMLDKIKATGVTPLALNSGSYIYNTLLYWIAQQVGGSPGIVDLGSGKRKFASPEVQMAVDRWASLKPYSNAGVPVTKSDANMKQMLQSKTGLMSGANLADLRVGLGQSVSITKMPNVTTDAPLRDSGIGGPGQAFVIPAASKNLDATVGFINFLNTPDQQLKRAKLNEGPFPNVPDLVGTDTFPDPLAKKLATWSTGKFVFWPDNTLDANLVTELAAKAQLVWNGNITSTQFLEGLDKKRDQILSGA